MAGEFVRRIEGENLDGPARGIAAEQGALRALVDFDPLHVRKVERPGGGVGLIDTVDIGRDVGVGTRQIDEGRNAADRWIGEPATRSILTPGTI